MNSVQLTGRLTRDPDLRYTSSQTAVCNITLAVDRVRSSQSGEKKADFPRIVFYGKIAETVNQWCQKGMKVAVEGRIQTGSYTDKNGNKVYTTDVVASRIEFLERREEHHAGGYSGGSQPQPQYAAQSYSAPAYTQSNPQQPKERQMDMMDIPPQFDAVDEDVPF